MRGIFQVAFRFNRSDRTRLVEFGGVGVIGDGVKDGIDGI
jgi:hypothetical protein